MENTEVIQKLNYKEASEKVLSFIKKELELQGKTLYLDDDIKKTYRMLTLYFSKNPMFEKYAFPTKNKNLPYSLKKGLLLLGTTGRSKTFIFKAFQKITPNIFHENSFRAINSTDIQLVFSKIGLEALAKYEYSYFDTKDEVMRRVTVSNSKTRDLYIDEIGFESPEIQFYGNIIKPMELVLFELHKLFMKGVSLTHASSNLTLEEFKERYTQRVYSRLFEMFNVITTEGQDLRLL